MLQSCSIMLARLPAAESIHTNILIEMKYQMNHKTFPIQMTIAQKVKYNTEAIQQLIVRGVRL